MLNELLPKWYKPVTLSNLSEETFKKRIADIRKIIKTKNDEWLYDCIRIYLGKPGDNDLVIKELKKIFGKSDPFFHQNDSSLELQILCGAIIHEAILGSRDDEQYKLGLIIRAAVFMMSNEIVNGDIAVAIDTYLTIQGDLIRNRDLPTVTEIPINFNWEVTEPSNPFLSTQFKELFLLISQQQKQTVQKLDSAYRTINLLREESNLLWWSFGSYSEGQLRSEIDKYSFPFKMGTEVANLITTIPPAQVTYQFLKKSTNEAKHENVIEPFCNFISSISNELCLTMASEYDNKLSNLLPIHFALFKRKESADNKGWIAAFEKNSLIEVNTEVSVFDFTKQFLTERLILKSK